MRRSPRPGAVLAAAALRPLVLLRDLLLAVLAVFVCLPLLLLPWRAAGALGRLYGRIAFLAWPAARRKAMINLRRAYGASVTRAAARETAARSLASLAQGIAEGIQFARRFAGSTDAWRPLVTAEDPTLEALVLSDPRPKVLVTAHLGSWELAAMIAGLLAPGGAAVARRVDNPFLDALATRWRGGRGAVIEKTGAVEAALARLRSGGSVALLLDENGGHRGLFVPFFSRPASTRKTAALLSLRTGAPIVVGAVVRRPGPRPFLYRLALLRPLPGGGRATPDDVKALTAEIAATIERWVREDPGQWRWVHHRWKTRPDGSEETYGRRDLRRAFSGKEER